MELHTIGIDLETVFHLMHSPPSDALPTGLQGRVKKLTVS
jgi:hypothetical protein